MFSVRHRVREPHIRVLKQLKSPRDNRIQKSIMESATIVYIHIL